MQHLSSHIQHFSNTKILCIGDIMLDCFISGKVDRVSPEAPVSIFSPKDEKYMLGGAGNVLANIISLGAEATFLGYVGNDDNGKHIISLLSKIGCKSKILKVKNHPTILKTRLIANNNHILRVDKEEILSYDKEILLKAQKPLEAAIKNSDIVLLSDYAKGTFTDESTPFIINLCNKHNKKVFIDPKGSDYTKYKGATLIKPNLKEFGQATGLSLDPKSEDFNDKIKKASLKFFNDYKIENIIITLSEHGMILLSNSDNNIVKIPTVAKEVFDVSGAGDTSLATLGVSTAANANIEDAMKLANIASGIVVGKLGTATTTKQELENAINSKNPNDIKHKKIITAKQASEISQSLQKQGKTVGFTNGCFDLMHLGHLHSFIEAKSNCDILFVGINSDKSVKKYKGEDRPIQDEKTRSLLVSSLEYVDYVIVFDDDTALSLIEEIKPNIIAKEGYEIENWPEAKKVISYGGKAITLPKLDGYSTSSTILKMKD